MHSSTTGTKSRPAARPSGVSTPPKSPGHTRVGRRGSGPTSFRCVPTARDQTRSRVARSHATTRPPFPAPNTSSRPPAARQDRRHVEVVVADVVREAPGRARGAGPWRRRGRRASWCRARGRDRRRRSDALSSRPRARGSRCRRRRGPAASTDTGFHAPPPPACAVGHGCAIVSNFQRTPTRAEVERIDRAPAAGREADGADVDAAAIDDGRDVDELLVPVGQASAPHPPPVRPVEREDGRVRRREDATARRPRRRSARRSAPSRCAPIATVLSSARARTRSTSRPGRRRSRRRRAASRSGGRSRRPCRGSGIATRARAS